MITFLSWAPDSSADIKTTGVLFRAEQPLLDERSTEKVSDSMDRVSMELVRIIAVNENFVELLILMK